jgi:hypothetical protein
LVGRFGFRRHPVLGSQAYGLVRALGEEVRVFSLVIILNKQLYKDWDRWSAYSVRYRFAESAPVPDRLCRVLLQVIILMTSRLRLAYLQRYVVNWHASDSQKSRLQTPMLKFVQHDC